MKVTVRGNTNKQINQPNDMIITYPGLGNSKMEIDFDDSSLEIKSVKFDGRPQLTQSQQKQMRANRATNSEACHRISINFVEQIIQSRVIGKTHNGFPFQYVKPIFLVLDPELKKLETRKAVVITLAEAIAKKYLEEVRKDFFSGDKTHNNAAGKLIQLLKPFVEKGKDWFEPYINQKNLRLTIPKNHKFANDSDYYKSLREYLGCEAIEFSGYKTNEEALTPWDFLLELYFSANYDQSDKSLNSKHKIGTDEAYKSATKTFISAYQAYGSYSVCAVSTNNAAASVSTAELSKKRKSPDDVSDQKTSPAKKIKDSDNETVNTNATPLAEEKRAFTHG